jgi:hypothetical protein
MNGQLIFRAALQKNGYLKQFLGHLFHSYKEKRHHTSISSNKKATSPIMSNIITPTRQYGERAEVQNNSVSDTLKRTPFVGLGKWIPSAAATKLLNISEWICLIIF